MQTRSAATSSCYCQPVFPKSASKKLKSLESPAELARTGLRGRQVGGLRGLRLSSPHACRSALVPATQPATSLLPFAYPHGLTVCMTVNEYGATCCDGTTCVGATGPWADERYPNSHPDHEYSTHQCAQYGSLLTESGRGRPAGAANTSEESESRYGSITAVWQP